MSVYGSGHGRGGFTLIELVVGLVISGMIALTVHAAVNVAAGALRQLERTGGPITRAVAVRRSLSAWIRAAAPVGPLPAFVGTDGGSGLRARDEFAFTVRDAGVLRPGPHGFRIAIDDDPNTRVTGLVVHIDNLTDGLGRHMDVLEAVPAATGLSIEYFGRIEGRDRWTEQWTASDGLPKVVRIRILGPAPSANPEYPAVSRRPMLIRIKAVDR